MENQLLKNLNDLVEVYNKINHDDNLGAYLTNVSFLNDNPVVNIALKKSFTYRILATVFPEIPGVLSDDKSYHVILSKKAQKEGIVIGETLELALSQVGSHVERYHFKNNISKFRNNISSIDSNYKTSFALANIPLPINRSSYNLHK
jgi:hypothetical protein